ncbi:MAG: sigma-54 dependent transcriptional regulator [Acidobacteriota bacterium]
MTQVYVVEDDPKIRANLLFQLRDEGYAPTAFESAEAVLGRLDSAGPPQLLLLDVRLPGRSGLDLVRQLTAEERLPPTVILSGEASISETVEALRLGVHDFIEKPFTKERLLQSLANALEAHSLRRQVTDLRTELGRELLGDSAAMARLRKLVAKAAPTDGRVLIRGESGTGKELVADALHVASHRCQGPLIKINCAAIPASMVEGELFGHVRGAFTDARADKAGLFEEAHGGSLFLDEIGDMPLELQGRLLRVLEDGQVRRLGETRHRQVDVRLIAATHQDLEARVQEGHFREDLFFRLAHLPIEIPPLREREGDIPLLFDHFLALYRRRHGTRRLRVDPELYDSLATYPWPGNVRELQSLAQRLTVFGEDPLDIEQLPRAMLSSLRGASSQEPGTYASGQGPGEQVPGTEASEESDPWLFGSGTGSLLRLPPGLPPWDLRELRRRVEAEYLESVLEHTGWNFAAAARHLGLRRTYLHQKAGALGIRRPDSD